MRSEAGATAWARWRSAFRAGCAGALACAACGGEAEVRAPGAEAAAPVRAAGPRAGGDTLAARPYRAPAGFPLPFHTAVPPDFRASADLPGPGAAVQFTWHPGDERRDSAFVYVRVMDEGTREDRAREIVRTAAERMRIPGDRTELEPREAHPWAVAEYPIRSLGTLREPVRGWIALGRREGRWFYVIAQSSVAAWPRFSAGAERILEAWRWTGPDGRPGGTGLRREG